MCGVVWCGVCVLCVVWCVWCGVVWCVVWCVWWCVCVCVVWCGVVWCGVVCGVVWCGVWWVEWRGEGGEGCWVGLGGLGWVGHTLSTPESVLPCARLRLIRGLRWLTPQPLKKNPPPENAQEAPLPRHSVPHGFSTIHSCHAAENHTTRNSLQVGYHRAHHQQPFLPQTGLKLAGNLGPRLLTFIHIQAASATLNHWRDDRSDEGLCEVHFHLKNV